MVKRTRNYRAETSATVQFREKRRNRSCDWDEMSESHSFTVLYIYIGSALSNYVVFPCRGKWSY